MTKVKINPDVCLTEKCQRDCDSLFVPDNCPCYVTHALVEVNYPIQRPRKSGKTTELIRVARQLMKEGKKVYYLVPVLAIGREVERFFRGFKDVKVISFQQAKNGGMRGLSKGFVLTDEIRPNELEELDREHFVLRFNCYVQGYYT